MIYTEIRMLLLERGYETIVKCVYYDNKIIYVPRYGNKIWLFDETEKTECVFCTLWDDTQFLDGGIEECIFWRGRLYISSIYEKEVVAVDLHNGEVDRLSVGEARLDILIYNDSLIFVGKNTGNVYRSTDCGIKLLYKNEFCTPAVMLCSSICDSRVVMPLRSQNKVLVYDIKNRKMCMYEVSGERGFLHACSEKESYLLTLAGDVIRFDSLSGKSEKIYKNQEGGTLYPYRYVHCYKGKLVLFPRNVRQIIQMDLDGIIEFRIQTSEYESEIKYYVSINNSIAEMNQNGKSRQMCVDLENFNIVKSSDWIGTISNTLEKFINSLN